jgi:hypothetical protein
MIDDTIQRIEARLRSSEAMPESTRAELLALLDTLKNEVSQLPASRAAQAQTIARATEVSAEQAMAPERDEHRYRNALNDLTGSVRDFEDSHPQLVQVVNNIANTLSGLGI